MPRSYSFDHYTAAQHDVSRSLQAEQKQHLSHSDAAASGALHYGRRHAQTEEILAARQMTRQLEQASMDDELDSEEGLREMYGELQALADEDANEEKREEKLEELLERPAAPLRRTGEAEAARPIGSLPAAPELPSPSRWREVMESAQRDARTLAAAARDARAASGRLLLLPLEVVKLFGKRLPFVRAS